MKKKKPSKKKGLFNGKQLDRIERKEDQELRELKQLEKKVENIEKEVTKKKKRQIKDFTLTQKGEKNMINGVQAGGSGVFQIGFVPPNGVPLQSGPTVKTSDSLVKLGAVGPSNQFTADVDASDTALSFDVTVEGVNGKGDPLSRTFTVPILAAPPPQITDFTLDQV